MNDDRKKIFDYDIFFESEQMNAIHNNQENFLERIRQVSGIAEIKIDSEFSIPEIKGNLIHFIDNDPSRKYTALLEALKFVNERTNPTKAKSFFAVCLVPNGKSYLIVKSKKFYIPIL